MIAPGYTNRMAARICSLAVTLLLSASALAGTAMDVRSGHAGHWYAAERSGEGWVLELRDAGNAWLYWFTYDEQGRQRWLTAAGQVVADGEDGQRIDFPQLVVTRGARFGAAFDPDEVIREAVGSASLHFDGCDSGRFSYSAFDQSQTFQVQRLARVMGTRCETPHGVTGREVADFAGQSGSWYDPAHNGEGYALHWATPEQAIVTWYSYDNQGNQYWMLGTGQLDGEGRIHFPDVHATRGARFGAAFDPEDVERFAWGELTFELACDGGSASYQSTLPAFGSGDFDLARLTGLHEVACPWRRPKLSDLYDIEVFDLPASITGHPGEQVYAFAALVDADAMVWTSSSSAGSDLPLRLPAGEQHWQPAGGLDMMNGRHNRLMLAADGTVYSSGRAPGSDAPMQPVHFVDDDWQALDMPLPEGAFLTGISQSGARRLGMVLAVNGEAGRPWQWGADTGLVNLRGPPSGPGPFMAPMLVPLFANETGTLVVGTYSGIPPAVPPEIFRTYVWRDDAVPQPLFDADGWAVAMPRACALDCVLVFGSTSSKDDPENPAERHKRREPWAWRSTTGEFHYLGRLPSPGHPPLYQIAGVSADGNVVAGSYGAFPTFSGDGGGPATAVRNLDAYVWMPLTGMVSIGDILDEAAAAPAPAPAQWEYLDVAGMSPDGRRLLLTDGRGASPHSPRRLAMLVMSPRIPR